MYDSKYLADEFEVSLSTIRTALRNIGEGVGTTGKYEFTEDQIDDILTRLATALNRPIPGGAPSVTGLAVPAESLPAYPASRGARVGQVLLDNKKTILLLILAILSAILGVDLTT